MPQIRTLEWVRENSPAFGPGKILTADLCGELVSCFVIDERDAPGFLAAIVGEFRWNFPWPVCIPFYLLYGVVLRLAYQRLLVDKGDFASVAIYAVLGLYLVEMVFGSPTQNVFEMMDVVIPMMLIRYLGTRRRSPAYSLPESQIPGEITRSDVRA